MAPNKPRTRNWYDVQMAIAAIAMSLTLALWNLFAGPDRAQAARKMAEEALITPPPIPTEEPVAALTPAPMPIVKIIFGSSAPQQTSSSPTSSRKNNRNDGGGGGGGGGSTKTS
jgi:hypothetical protein